MTDYSRFTKRIMVTGGAGFIGSNLLLLLVPRYPEYLFVNVDCLTYAGNLANLRPIEAADNYRFERIDICETAELAECFERYQIDGVIHLAAESHVDRSIVGPGEFVRTNITGTFNLLELVRRHQEQDRPCRFHHVSTDEVFGSLGEEGLFTESSQYCPNSPYAASKAAADHLVRSYNRTYGLDVVTTNCSNNYGPYQFPEKLIPLMIHNARGGIPLPVYGDGLQVRDWLYVEDHCEALDLVFHRGKPGVVYNVGGHNEVRNIDLVRLICRMMDEKLGGTSREKLIEFVKDRPGHDRRYAIDASLIQTELGFAPQHTFEDGIRRTIEWYLDNNDWLNSCTSGQYLKYYEEMYSNR